MTRSAAALMLISCLAVSADSGSSLSRFVGKWRNASANTRGITTAEVRIEGSKIIVRLWGACAPKDCDLGERVAIAYSDSVGEKVENSTRALVVDNGSRSFFVLKLQSDQSLVCESYTTFADGSGRANVMGVDVLKPSLLTPGRR